MPIIINNSTVKDILLANGTKISKVIKTDGTVLYESVPDIIYTYNNEKNVNYPLGNNSSTTYAASGARDDETNVYLGSYVDGSYTDTSTKFSQLYLTV